MDIHQPLVEAAEDDIYEVKDEVDSLTERWENLNVEIDERRDRLSKLNQGLNAMSEKMVPVEEFITSCEQTLDNQEPVGIDKEKSNEQLCELDVSVTRQINIVIVLIIIQLDLRNSNSHNSNSLYFEQILRQGELRKPYK